MRRSTNSAPTNYRRIVVRKVLKTVAILAFSALTAIAYLVLRSHDPLYVVRELKNWSDYRRYDQLIVRIAGENHLDPRLVKAVVWRESRFQSDMVGRTGERGLMQVSEVAAREWAGANAVKDFEPTQLLQPELNVQVGAWYLSKAMQHWMSQDDPVPFALAEYNAGKTRVDRWRKAASHRTNAPVNAKTFAEAIDFPSTLYYVRSIVARYDFYKRRGPLLPAREKES